VFENRVLRRVFGSKRDEVTGEWKKIHNEELSNLYSLPNIVRVVKARRMRWAGHVCHFIFIVTMAIIHYNISNFCKWLI